MVAALVSAAKTRSATASTRLLRLDAPVAAFGIGAHKQKNEPAGGAGKYDRH